MLARQTTRAPAAAARAHLPPPSRLPALGNQAQLRRLQAKLTIGAVNDPLEHEADKAADHVMRMTDPGMSLTAAAPRLSRKCAACEEDNAHMQRQPAGPATQAASGAAPGPLVQDTLSRPGQKLDPATRAFFEPRFGRSLDAIRVHTDERAAASAQAVGAAAYAVGPQIVFGANHYQPGTAGGRHLLAHELAHTIQQSGPEPTLRRAPCNSGAAACPKAIPGDPARFSSNQVAAQAAQDAAARAAPAGSPAAQARLRMGERAVNFEALLARNGIPLAPEVDGFFVNSNMDPSQIGAQTTQCKNFPDHNPGASPASPDPATMTPDDKFCIQVPAQSEDRAKALATFVGPFSANQSRQLAEILRIGVHEMQHATFDKVQLFAATRTILPEADCTLDIRAGAQDVEFLLTEISAETSEFPLFFKNTANQPKPVPALEREERNQATNSGESIRGAIRTLKCACSCPTTDKFVTQTVNNTMSGWPAPQSLAFLQAMTRIIPTDWPAALKRN